jgi:hypothetical protein
LLARVEYDRGLDSFLRLFDFAFVACGLGLRQALLELRETLRRHIVRMLALRTRGDDF